MTDQHLSELLERAADRVNTGAPPTAAIVQDAGRVRRRRTLTFALVSAAAVVVVAGGTTVLTNPGDNPGPQPPVASPSPAVPSADQRLVGVGRVAIAVPQRWGTNDTQCGTPQRDTVVIDVGAIPMCLIPRPRGVDSIEITEGEPRFDFTADETLTVDGVAAQRQATTCETGYGDSTVCHATVYFPSLEVSFRAESSTGPAQVDRILEGIQMVSDQVGVPGYQRIADNQQGNSGEKYLQALGEAGLASEVRTQKYPGIDAGYVLDVSPQPGEMVKPGSVVTVTVVAEPEGPADEVRVGMAAGEGEEALEDSQIRAGGTLELAVGDRVWAYASGRRAGTLAGELDGDSLTIDNWEEGPNYPHSWVASTPGRTEVTLTITADGAPVVLGTVTVVVR